jgi:murein L,D-transpeptidase YcbB/YkuD
MGIYKYQVRMPLLAVFILLLVGSCKNKTSENPSEDNNLKSSVTMGSSEDIKSLISDQNSKFFRKDSVAEFYASRNFEPAWKNISLRQAFIDTLRSIKSQGLYFEDYHGPEIESMNSEVKNMDNKQQSKFDVLLTDAFFRFGDHLYNGKTNPTKIHEIWDVDKEKIDLNDLLELTVEKNDLELALKKIRPQNPIYKQLIAAEKEYRQKIKDSDNFKEISEGETIKPGMPDSRIQEIQFRLLALGYLESLQIGSNSYSQELVEAIKKFQEDQGLSMDGNIGNETINFLNRGNDKRYEQILVNLERWRWYPRELGDHYILINIPAYSLKVIMNGDTLKTHKVMVGTGSRKTPIFSEEIDHLVFNPDWHIPPTIKTRDVIPGIRDDPNYLAQKNIEVFDSSGNKLNPSDIEWSGNEVKNYKYKQAPGSSNPLGRVKIIYPNEYLIYLHDTPSTSLFGRNSRAQSSGCVRVQDALNLAEYLLKDQPEITSDKIQSILNSGITKRIDMKQQVKVHHFYWTVWRENGKTKFTRDIYEYDDKILKALQNAS